MTAVARRLGPLGRGTVWITASFAVRLALQAMYFVVVARMLGAAGFGAFAGVAAAVGLVAPFVGLGGGNLLVRDMARSTAHFGTRWGETLIRSMATALGLALLAVAAAATVLPPAFPVLLLAMVALADLVFTRLVDQSAQAFQGARDMRRVAWLQVLPMALRFLATLPMLAGLAPPTPAAWSWLYFGSAVVAGTIAVGMVNARLGQPTLRGARPFRELREGGHFALSHAAHNVHNDADKAILAALTAPAIVGVYTAAYRVVDVSFAPIRALQLTAYSEFFRRGMSGLRGTLVYARKLMVPAAAYAVGILALLYAAAPLVPLLFGTGFADAAGIVRWLAVLPLLRAVQLIAADTLTGAGYQDWRSVVQFAVAGGNVALNLALIPRYSWTGAVWATLISDLALALTLWAGVAIAAWRGDPRRSALSDVGARSLR